MIPKHALTLINDIHFTGKQITKWERKFLRSVSEISQDNKILTEAQTEVLQNIHLNYCTKGAK